VKADDKLLEDDGKPDPRFAETAEQLKKENVTDFQLDYAVKTIARLGTPAVQTAMADAPSQAGTAKTRKR
jgi:carboxyl-terminal processing protease